MIPFVWTPGPQRRITLFATARDPSPARAPAVLPLRWPDHPAAAMLDYTLDAAALRASDTDAISIQALTASGIAVAASLVHGSLITMWLGAATAAAGTDALVDLTLVTAGGRRVHRIIRLRVV